MGHLLLRNSCPWTFQSADQSQKRADGSFETFMEMFDEVADEYIYCQTRVLFTITCEVFFIELNGQNRDVNWYYYYILEYIKLHL